MKRLLERYKKEQEQLQKLRQDIVDFMGWYDQNIQEMLKPISTRLLFLSVVIDDINELLK